MSQQQGVQVGTVRLDKPRLWTKPFITLTLASFLLFLNLQMLLSSFSVHIKNNLDGADLHVSLATSVFALAAIVARLLTGKWMKLVPRETLLTIGLIVAAVSTILTALPNTIAPLLVMRIIYGLGFGVGSTIIPTLVTQIIPPKRIGEGIGYFGLSTSLAMSIGPATGMFVMKEAGFSTLASVGAGVVVCMFPLLLIAGAYKRKENKKEAVIEIGSKREQEQHSSKQPGEFRRLFVFPIYFPALLNVCISITYSGILSFIAVYGEQLQLAQVGLFFLFNALTILLVRPIAGKLFDRKGPFIVLIPAALLVVASMIILSYTTTMGVLIVSALLYGLGFGSIQPTLQAWMLRSANKEDYGAVNGMFYNSTDLGVSLGAIILGVVATLTSYETMYRASSICMVIFTIAIITYIMKRRKTAV